MTRVERTAPGRFLIVQWQSGGGAHPAIGLGRLLAARGHDVRHLAPRVHRARIEAVGCRFRPFPRAAEFDPSKGRALEEQQGYVSAVVHGPTLAEAVLDEVAREPADVLVVDHQIRAAMSAAERVRSPTVVFVHTAFRFHGAQDPDVTRTEYELGNALRARLGLPDVPVGSERFSVALQRRAARVLVVMPAEFDPRDVTLPNLVHVGPIFEEDPSATSWEPPWRPGDAHPLVLVSLSSQYMHQEDALRRIIGALHDLPLHVLVTTGHELDASEVAVSGAAAVVDYVPHVAVAPHASLVVTHGGMGTIMAAFAFGVPLVCMPLGRDQEINADRVEALGAGRRLAGGAPSSKIRETVLEALGSDGLRAGARHMSELVGRYRSGALAVEELEGLLSVASAQP